MSGRYSPSNHIFDAVGLTCFADKIVDTYFILALFCSKVSSYFLLVLNPTLSITTGAVANLPVLYTENISSEIKPFVLQCIKFAKVDWDSYETSWDFKRSPLI